ncbi:MAG TPA: hypothetical protein VF017_00840 [Thermoanaerobaculia bacterium]|nr:hypothetical protein [Thermoanaerobaculia bacterium]
MLKQRRDAGGNPLALPSRGELARLRGCVRRAAERAAQQQPRPLPEKLPGLVGAKLGSLAPARRRAWIVARPYLRRPEMVHALCRASHDAARQDADHAERLARAALELARALDGKPFPALAADLEAESLAMLANALRVQERYGEAAGSWLRARLLLQAGTGDALLRARLDFLQTSFLRALRRLPEALEVGRRSLAAFQALEQWDEAFLAGLKLSYTLYVAGDPAAALEVLADARHGVSPEVLARHRLGVLHNRALYLTELGLNREARRELYQAGPLYETEATESLRLQRCWIEGKLLANAGRWWQAAGAFGGLRQLYLSAGRPFDAALVGMDLLLCLAEQGDLPAASRLAGELLAVFAELELPEETRAVLDRLDEAARRFRADAALVRLAHGELQPLRRLPPRWSAV